MSYLSRYEAGEHEQVWQEIYPRYWREAQSEPFFSEAVEVARATMRRVRQNIEILISRLEAIGYSLGYEWMRALPHVGEDEAWAIGQSPVFSPSLPGAEASFQRLEGAGIRPPLSIRAWYEIVGSVNLVGTPPTNWSAKSCHSHDPLRVDPLSDESNDECTEERRLSLSPDEYCKYFVNGGGPYFLSLRHPSTDGLVEGDWLSYSFVEYRRVAFSWGGFPGIGRWRKRAEKGSAFLTEGLVEF